MRQEVVVKDKEIVVVVSGKDSNESARYISESPSEKSTFSNLVPEIQRTLGLVVVSLRRSLSEVSTSTSWNSKMINPGLYLPDDLESLFVGIECEALKSDLAPYWENEGDKRQ